MNNFINKGNGTANEFYGNMYQNNMYHPQNQPGLSQKDFLNLPQLYNIKIMIYVSAMMLYFFSVENLVLILNGTIVGEMLFVGIFDCAVLLVFGILIQTTYSRVVGVIVLCYGILQLLISIVKFGTMGGLLVVVAGIFAVYVTFKFDKIWKDYVNYGNIPNYK